MSDQPTIAELQAQIEALTSAAKAVDTYHVKAHADLNSSGILASGYAAVLHTTRAAARGALTVDAAVYKSCDVAITKLGELNVA